MIITGVESRAHFTRQGRANQSYRIRDMCSNIEILFLH